MYRREGKGQLSFEDFYLPFGGKLDGNNRWIKLSALVPWEEFEEKYADQFSDEGMGAPAKPFRMALGSALIKRRLDISDEEVVEQIRENPYLQYFIGEEAYRNEAPFDPSMMVHFRKRLSVEMLNEVNEEVIAEEHKKKETKEGSSEKENKGKLLVDATCVPQDIRYPTDLSLLNEAREKTEGMIDELHKSDKKKQSEVQKKKVRSYRKKARKGYLAVAKKRKKSKREIRKGIRQQLGYIRRNLKNIIKMWKAGGFAGLNARQQQDLVVIEMVYEQQEEMYKKKTHHVEDRIVSISQPQVRPIVRGKAGAEVEFGAKLTISVVNNYTRIEKLSWNNYHEGIDLIEQIKQYKERYGYYPESVHVDKIYQNRENRNFCKEHKIRISGPKLGRPKKEETEESAAMKVLSRQDANDRQPVEGKIGNLKRKYGLDLVMAKLAETSESEIAAAILMLNLEVKLRCSFIFIFCRVFSGQDYQNGLKKPEEYFGQEASKYYARLYRSELVFQNVA
jgi:hypothetical protein